MMVTRTGASAAGRRPRIGALVTDRWRPRVDEPLAGRYRRCTPPPRSLLIRHSDELRCDTDSLMQTAIGRAHG
jgi:hypothetical protein